MISLFSMNASFRGKAGSIMHGSGAPQPFTVNQNHEGCDRMGTLWLVATPIGNLEDITHRAVRVLGEADVLACEDTRQTAKILERYGIPRPKSMVSYHEHNEERAGAQLLTRLEEGQTVALCSDGGMPGISDPGYRLVSEAIEAGHSVEALPGASAVQTALVVSGLPTSSYTYLGFPPRKSGQRQRFFGDEADRLHTLVVFESPHRVGKMLADAFAALGDRRAAVCIELTKKFERVQRGFLSDLVREFGEGKVRGEVTVVIAGNHPKFLRT
jgi:16S rRNA (cytidine1402-2'-O)-methyltransferase